ncbi:PTS sugar transporter subunit IIA domain-containing protein [Lacrimispora brassicae]
MTGIVVTGHGHFPTGILSAVALVAGRPNHTVGVDFEEGQSPEDLKKSMENAMESLEGDEVLILADLLGGTPFKMGAAIKAENPDRKIKVIAGVNMAALVEAVFSRPLYDLEGLAAAVIQSGKDGLADLDHLERDGGEPEFEDGL